MSRAVRSKPSTQPQPASLIPKGTIAPLVCIAAVLGIALVLGGGGVRYAFSNLVVQLAALTLLAIRQDSVFAFWRGAPLSLRLLVGLSILVPLLQLVPLPPALWTGLPGRELVQQSFELTGRTGWAPLSVDPVRTLVALTGLIVPVAILTGGWSVPRAQLISLGWVIALLGFASVIVGVLQVVSQGTQAVMYSEVGTTGVLYGTFANRNSTGLFLVAALMFAIFLPSPRPHPAALPARIGISLLLILGIVLTRSRTALVLASIPLALAALRAFVWSRRGRSIASDMRRSRAPMAVLTAIVLSVGVIAAIVVVAPGRVGDTIERFEATSDARIYIWEDAAYSASRYWPVGAGMGTFDEVFQIDESLENTTQRRAGRAHNDFFEVAIEAGLAGVTLIGAWLALIAWLCWQVRHDRLRWVAWGSGAILLTVALQSITDYPLRNQAMLAVASLALLLLARIAADRKEAGE